jgi:hypothetical protein
MWIGVGCGGRQDTYAVIGFDILGCREVVLDVAVLCDFSIMSVFE